MADETATGTIFDSNSAEETEAFAEAIGGRLRGGEVIELLSDLGGGKTTFVRGLARGAGSADHVASPTFTVSREYECPDGIRIYHFDFYRLAEAGIVAQELQEVAYDPKAVSVVEWSDKVQHVLPAERLQVTISRTSDDGRRLVVNAGKHLAYLLEEDGEA